MPLPAEEKQKLRKTALEVGFPVAGGMEVIQGTPAMGNVPQTRQQAEVLSLSIRDTRCLQRTGPRTLAPRTTNLDQVHHTPTASRPSMSRRRREPSYSASSTPQVSVRIRLAKIIHTGQRRSRDLPPFQRSQTPDPTLTRWSMPVFYSTQHRLSQYQIHPHPSSLMLNPRRQTDSMTVVPSNPI